MIFRHAKILGINTSETRGTVGRHAVVEADGVKVTFALTAEEYPLAKSAMESGSALVLALSIQALEEP